MKKILIIFVIFVLFILFDGYFINTHGFKVVEESIEVEGLVDSFDGFKIVQFSDTLIGSITSVSDMESVVNSINELKPDIIIFTGDLIASGYTLSDSEKQELINILSNLECSMYKYAIIGDRDKEQIEVYESIMLNSDFTILDNESIYLFYKDNTPIKITGITDLGDISSALTLEDEYDTTLNIVLTHYPDYIDELYSYDIDLVFAGHSLKGEARIPFYGGIIKKDGATTYLDSKYIIGNTSLYVSGGLGTDSIGFRLFNKPEINLYRLESI